MRPVAASVSPQSDAELVRGTVTPEMSAAARSTLVNRTHRVVRERARTMQENRKNLRSLLLPLLLCFLLMVTLIIALWVLLDQYDLVSSELPPSIHHFFMLLLWFLPVSAGLVAMVWFRRSRNHSNAEAGQ